MTSRQDEYQRLINGKWQAAGYMQPDKAANRLLIPSDQQAMRGCRALFRKATGRPWRGRVAIAKRGNQYTWERNGVLVVNPARPAVWNMIGWPDMVHMMAHLAHWYMRPDEKPHSPHQLALETELTNFALSDAFAKYRVD